MEWLEKKQYKCSKDSKGEVFISLITKNSHPSVAIRFAKNSWLKITKNDHVIIGVENGRLYFNQGEDYQGWKLSTSGKSTKIFKVYQEVLPIGPVETGEYNLEFDSRVGLYYIDVRNKLNKETIIWKGKR